MNPRRAIPIVLFSLLAAGCGGDKGLPEPWSKLKVPRREAAKEVTAGQGSAVPKDKMLYAQYPKVTDFMVLCQEFRLALEPIGFTFDSEMQPAPHMLEIKMTRDGSPWIVECGYYEGQDLAIVEVKAEGV